MSRVGRVAVTQAIISISGDSPEGSIDVQKVGPAGLVNKQQELICISISSMLWTEESESRAKDFLRFIVPKISVLDLGEAEVPVAKILEAFLTVS